MAPRRQNSTKTSAGGASNPVAKLFEKAVGLLGFHIVDPHYSARAERLEKKTMAAAVATLNVDDEVVRQVNVAGDYASAPVDESTEGELGELQARIATALGDTNTVGATVVKVFDKAEALTGMKREKLAMIGAALVGCPLPNDDPVPLQMGVYLILGYFAELVCNFIGFAYPSYASYKAVRSVDKEDDTQWLTYWTVFAVFSLADFFSASIMSVFPFYWVIKCLFMAWLYLPMTRGAEQVFSRAVIPIMGKVDKLLGVKTQ